MRIFLLHHVTWSINSICHFFGTRRFATEDHSTNVFWLALPSARRGLAPQPPRLPALGRARPARAELDPSGWVIAGMEKLGLVWDVVRITPERQQQRLAGAEAPAPAAPARETAKAA